jgi:hypothetical protein
MTLRPGSYDASSPLWRGVIRDDSLGRYACTHADHPNRKAATKCARDAFAQFKEEFKKDRPPAGWEILPRWRQ